MSASSGSQDERVTSPIPQAGTWWVLVQNWDGSGANAVGRLHRSTTAAVPGTDSATPASTARPARSRRASPTTSGSTGTSRRWRRATTWYGTAVLGTSPATAGRHRVVPGDHPSRRPTTSRRRRRSPRRTIGDPISYDITVQPNVTPEDLTYTIVDTVPDGQTIDPASVTGGGVVDGQTITWTITDADPGRRSRLVRGVDAGDEPAAAREWAGSSISPRSASRCPGARPATPFAATAFQNIGPFEQFGEDFAGLAVPTTGSITVAGGYGRPPWVPQAIPDPQRPNGVFAPAVVRSGALRRGRTGDAPRCGRLDVAVIQWDDPFEFGGDRPTFELGRDVPGMDLQLRVAETDPRRRSSTQHSGRCRPRRRSASRTSPATSPRRCSASATRARCSRTGGSICLDYKVPCSILSPWLRRHRRRRRRDRARTRTRRCTPPTIRTPSP